MYGFEINADLVQIYLAFEFGKFWAETTEIEWFNRCVLTAGIISNTHLRNAVVISIFTQFASTKLENVISVVDKARKIPKDVILSRMTGLTLEIIPKFLDLCLSLLDFLVTDPVSTCDMMLGAIQESLRNNYLQSSISKSYYDDAIGTMMENLKPDLLLSRYRFI
jgi:hypothetical protein